MHLDVVNDREEPCSRPLLQRRLDAAPVLGVGAEPRVMDGVVGAIDPEQQHGAHEVGRPCEVDADHARQARQVRQFAVGRHYVIPTRDLEVGVALWAVESLCQEVRRRHRVEQEILVLGPDLLEEVRTIRQRRVGLRPHRLVMHLFWVVEAADERQEAVVWYLAAQDLARLIEQRVQHAVAHVAVGRGVEPSRVRLLAKACREHVDVSPVAVLVHLVEYDHARAKAVLGLRVVRAVAQLRVGSGARDVLFVPFEALFEPLSLLWRRVLKNAAHVLE